MTLVLPLEADDCQGEDRAHSGHGLHVVDDLTGGVAHRPAVGEQSSDLPTRRADGYR